MIHSLLALLEHPGFVEGDDWRRADFQANEIVFREGDVGRQVYILLRGQVRISGEVSLEQEKHIRPAVCDLHAFAVFGELALFDSAPRSATVVALSDIEVAVIDGNKLLGFFDAHPEIGYPVMRELIGVLVARLRQTNQKVWSLLAWGLKVHAIDRHL